MEEQRLWIKDNLSFPREELMEPRMSSIQDVPHGS